MSLTGGIVLFVVIWFLALFITLQITTHTQGDAGEIVPGTHEGAPDNFRIGRTFLITTAITVPLWGLVAAIILSGAISVEDLDWMHVLGERVPN